MKRIACYIDGFNLYNAIHDLHIPHFKWLNLWSLSESLARSDEHLVSVNYFSAYATWRPAQYKRHREYIKALSFFGVTPILSHFKEKYRRCRACGATWTDHEEKETDVRLALKLLEDAFNNLYDRAIIISGDSDLVPAIQSVLTNFPDKSILVATPPGRFSSSRDLCKVANSKYEIRSNKLASHLLPETLSDSKGVILVVRPAEYNPPI